MAVHFFEEDRKLPFQGRKNKSQWLRRVVENEGWVCGVINLVFCSDDYLRKLNSEFLKRDYNTDVISFGGRSGNNVSGDVFISCDRVVENALEFKVESPEEFDRVMVHGILHLTGYDDIEEKEKEEMTRLENKYLGMRN